MNMLTVLFANAWTMNYICNVLFILKQYVMVLTFQFRRYLPIKLFYVMTGHQWLSLTPTV